MLYKRDILTKNNTTLVRLKNIRSQSRFSEPWRSPNYTRLLHLGDSTERRASEPGFVNQGRVASRAPRTSTRLDTRLTLFSDSYIVWL